MRRSVCTLAEIQLDFSSQGGLSNLQPVGFHVASPLLGGGGQPEGPLSSRNEEAQSLFPDSSACSGGRAALSNISAELRGTWGEAGETRTPLPRSPFTCSIASRISWRAAAWKFQIIFPFLPCRNAVYKKAPFD